MGFDLGGFDIDALGAAIRQTGDKAIKHGIEEMRKEGEALRDLARHYAPHDEGKLEAAIKSQDAEGGRDELGRLQRKSVEVFVDQDMPGSGGAETVGQYAYYMHEGLSPHGEAVWFARKGTTDKGPQAGGKYMERAVRDRAQPFYQRMRERFRRFFS